MPQRASRARFGRVALRADERALLASAGGVFALASAGAAMAASAADGMFLAQVGAAHLGEAVAASSALLAGVLAVIGALVDRLDRRRVLVALAAGSAAVVGALAAAAAAFPSAVAVAALIGGKQLAAATDLAFWVVIAERVDARRSARMLPLLAAVGGLGATVGAWLVPLVAPALGARGVLALAAVVLAGAGVGGARLTGTGRATAPAGVRGVIARSWRDGARAALRHPLARHLAIVVAIAGAFASLVYMALGVAVVASGGDERALVALLGEVRGAGQLATLVVQVAIAPALLARAGTGRALVVAPLGALAAAAGLVVAPVLAVAIAAQLSARVLDAAVETPAEKVALALLPTASRGRIGGFLDGPAKRGGAVVGGLLAAALAGAPAAFYAAVAGAAALWLVAAWRVARELPALAIEHAATVAADDPAVLDDRATAALIDELAGPRPERAAELLARIHVDADEAPARATRELAPALARACVDRGGPIIWRSLCAVLDRPAPGLGPVLLEAASAARDRDRALAIRAVGLAGGVGADGLARWEGGDDDGLALVAEIAALRLASAAGAVVDTLADALRGGDVARCGVAIDELVVELARVPDDGLAAAATLGRALRRRRGSVAARTAGFGALARFCRHHHDRRSAELALLRADLLELVRDRIDDAASAVLPPDHLVSMVRHAGDGVAARESAAALRLYAALLDGADAVQPEDIHRVVAALGEPDDDVRAAAEAAIAALGPAAAGALLDAVAWGRRRARDRAVALLADLPVTAAALDRLVDAELDALDATATAIAVLREPGDELIARRLDERLRETAHTVLLLVAARRRSPAIARAAAAWRRAHNRHERARTLAVVETALPRALVGRLVDAVDDAAPAERAAALVAAGATLPPRDAVVRAELAGRDRLARAMVLHAIGAAGRNAHRDTIARAAHDEASAAAPHDVLRRLVARIADLDATAAAPDDAPGADMPNRIETLIALGRVPLLAALTTRQLGDVVERARALSVRAGEVVIAAGDSIDALIAVEDGELALGERRIGKGEVVDELACVAPVAAATDLRATTAARLIRLDRADFEQLVDDVPGLAAAVCRALGERARRAEDKAYRSPLTTAR